ncbi:hypothetical protein GCM10023084_45310 [Streptomyces lacrimifluminis]|uniref:Lipoprotein n=1 Tax=Streptomyces lacrimifluminis TaxID=1500077 RepID=A0A917P1I6_9ACTN|nr:hypothetical protein [Streptomyces lacrimifluminis]GGJ45123.1 hypothetical protein GCM10012282_47530 [Streptomyces lacrimifluminis]
MTRRPSPRAVRLLASALGMGTLLTMAACMHDEDRAGAAMERRQARPVASPTAPVPAAQRASASPTAQPALTDTQAQGALLTDADLGAPWAPTEGAAIWRDGLLKATTDNADCGRLLDAAYTEELVGEPSGARAVVGFDDYDEGGQLRYQVIAAHRADVDERLAWLKTMPRKCARFTAVGPRGARQEVRVTEVGLPQVGDARQGLRLSTRGELDGAPATLTLDLAAVRVGDDAIVLTNGGLTEPRTEYTVHAVQVGAERLKQTRKETAPLPQTPVQDQSQSPTRGPVQPQPQPREQEQETDQDLY